MCPQAHNRAGFGSQNAFTRALTKAASTLKVQARQQKEGRGLHVQMLDPGLGAREQGGEGYGEGDLRHGRGGGGGEGQGEGLPQQNVQSVNVGDDLQGGGVGRGGGALGPMGHLGRQARRRSKIEAAKGGAAKGGGGLQVSVCMYVCVCVYMYVLCSCLCTWLCSEAYVCKGVRAQGTSVILCGMVLVVWVVGAAKRGATKGERAYAGGCGWLNLCKFLVYEGA